MSESGRTAAQDETFRASRKIISETPLDQLTYRLIKDKLEQLNRPQITKCIQDPEQWKGIKLLVTDLIQDKASMLESKDAKQMGQTKSTSSSAPTPTPVLARSPSPIMSSSPSKPVKATKSLSDRKQSTSNVESREEQIRKLKSYVHKCGVRKIWKKELEGLTEEQSIVKLKGILRDLGIEGRPSITKCNELREKLEFAKEVESLDTRNILPSRRKRGEESSPTDQVPPRLVSSDPLDLSALGDPESD